MPRVVHCGFVYQEEVLLTVSSQFIIVHVQRTISQSEICQARDDHNVLFMNNNMLDENMSSDRLYYVPQQPCTSRVGLTSNAEAVGVPEGRYHNTSRRAPFKLSSTLGPFI